MRSNPAPDDTGTDRAGLAAWSDPEHSLTAIISLLATPLSRTLPRLSEIVEDLFPHRALLKLTGDCAASPLKSCGQADLAEPPATAEMTRLAGFVDVGEPWFGHIDLGGSTHPVLAVASTPQGSAGSLLAVVLSHDRAPSPAERRFMQLLWDLTVGHIRLLNTNVEPAYLSQGRIASNTRSRTVAELTDMHAVTLSTLLSTLRSRDLADATARRSATDLAASALIELRTISETGSQPGEETADGAFARLADKLALLMRYNDVRLELSPPEQPQYSLPVDIANAARATVRGAVLVMLEQSGVTRIRVSWEVEAGGLNIAIRDDGPGGLSSAELGIRRLAIRLGAFDAQLHVEGVPGWGTTITSRIALSSLETPDAHPIATLNPRELDVLQQLNRGRRNRQIAQDLHISEHTVKFHVANILDKLGVASRGEAAAAARDYGLAAPPRLTTP